MRLFTILAFIVATCALVLEVDSRVSMDQRIQRLVDERERAYCSSLAAKLNRTRELMGGRPVNPRNFAELLEAYFGGMAAVMEQGVSNAVDGEGTNRPQPKP